MSVPANSTLDAQYLVVKDNWPGTPERWGFTAQEIYDASNVQYPKFPVGTKIKVRNLGTTYGSVGSATLIYLQVGTQSASVAIAAKTLVVPESATNIYKVTNSKATTPVLAAGCPYAAFALKAMTNLYYGFFVCDGAIPADFFYISGSYILSGNFATDSTVAVGPVQTIASANSDDSVLLSLGANATTTATCGFSTHADA